MSVQTFGGYQAVTDVMTVLNTWDTGNYGALPIVRRGWLRTTDNLQGRDYIYVSIREPEIINPFLHGDEYLHETKVILDLFTGNVTNTTRIEEMANSVGKLIKDNVRRATYVDWVVITSRDESDTLVRLFHYIIKIRIRKILVH